jgi:hypothetical protein
MNMENRNIFNGMEEQRTHFCKPVMACDREIPILVRYAISASLVSLLTAAGLLLTEGATEERAGTLEAPT